jgi:hypothetical protein
MLSRNYGGHRAAHVPMAARNKSAGLAGTMAQITGGGLEASLLEQLQRQTGRTNAATHSEQENDLSTAEVWAMAAFYR